MPSLDLGDVTLAYDDTGTGDPPLLLVHGYTGSKLDFVDVIDHLAATRRVVAYDHRGHGESTNTGDAATYTFDHLAHDLERFVDGIGFERFHLLGHSMGGVLALRYVLAQPERVHSLVLMDTSAAPMSVIPREFVEYASGVARERGMGSVAGLFANAMPNTPAVIARRLVWKFERLDVEAFDALARELSEYPSMVEQLVAVECPVTVVVGEHDTGLRPAADVLADRLRGATLSVIPDAGHSPQDENRAAWLAAIDAHFERQGWTTQT